MPHFRDCLFLVLLSLLLVAPVQAQSDSEPDPDACRDGLTTLKALAPDIPLWSGISIQEVDSPCFLLASTLRGAFSVADASPSERSDAVSSLSPRRLQLPQNQVGNDAGSAAQGSAVPATTPLELGGGNLSAIGTTDGTKTLASVTLNPFSLFSSSDASVFDVLGRGELGDVTLMVPASTVNQGSAITYVGIRARVNITALPPGSERMQTVTTRFDAILDEGARITNTIQSLLADAEDVSSCVTAIYTFSQGSGSAQDVKQSCNSTVTLQRFDASLEAALDKAVDAALDEAQRQFFGLDLRSDFGDPTLVGADSSEGTRLYGGLAFGRRFAYGDASRLGIGVRAGGKYVDLTQLNETTTAVEGALDVSYQRTYAKQQLHLSGGLEGGYTDGSNDALDRALQTDYLTFRAAVNVPLTSAYSLAINLAAPIAGSAESTFSVKLNWNLLFPDGE